MSDQPAALLCLASASPRRRELLAQIGVPHTTAVPNIDESVLAGEAAADYVLRMARTKALAVRGYAGALPVLGADTIVVLDGAILGKPGSAADGLAMLARLSGRTHTVLTAVAPAGRGALRRRQYAPEHQRGHFSGYAEPCGSA